VVTTSRTEIVPTGLAGLDPILSGGVPRGNVILIEGQIGTGKTTLGTEFVYRGAKDFGEPGIIVVFEVSPDKLTRDAAGLGWDLAEMESKGLLKIIFTTREVFLQELQHADSVLIEEARRIGARRIFIDGTAGLVPFENHGSRDAFHVLVQGLAQLNLTSIMALEPEAMRGHDCNPSHEAAIVDTVIRLRVEEHERASTRSIEVLKSRGHDFQMGRHSFRIIDGMGMQVYRRVQAPRNVNRELAAAFDPDARATTGVPGLDELVNGGYFLGSTTVVAGISGVGKSVMALHFMAEGARLGERCLMLSLDEQVPQILRNGLSIGIDLRNAIDRGICQLHYDPPQEIEIDRHFHNIESIIREFKPKRVVIDSLSTYGSSLGTNGRLFRDFFHALVALMKEHRIAGVYNNENPEMLGMSRMMGTLAMSSLIDNILLLNFIELGDTFRLGLTVAKMRSNPVNRATRECVIVNGQGMRVLPRTLPLTKTAFSGYGGLISRSPERRSPETMASAGEDDGVRAETSEDSEGLESRA
jgi:circadian clock protein KaiC